MVLYKKFMKFSIETVKPHISNHEMNGFNVKSLTCKNILKKQKQIFSFFIGWNISVNK